MLHANLHLKRISSLINQGKSYQAITPFHQLHQKGVKFTKFLLSSALRACANIGAIEEGEQFHCMIFLTGFHGDNYLMTSLIDMYSKCSRIREAYQVFAEIPQRDVVAINSMIYGFCHCNQTYDAIKLFNNMSDRDTGSWNTLISGLGHSCEGKMGLTLFERMRVEGQGVDVMTMVSVLSICADMAALVNGRKVHGLVIKHGMEPFLPVGNALVDVYAKCGMMDDAYYCFKIMPWKNVVSWTCLIAGYGKNGYGLEAVRVFHAMEMEGVSPNKITFLATLHACSHAGLVEEGWSNFDSMVHKYSISPMMEHYICMVDLLSRAGKLTEAYDFTVKMSVKPESKIWMALLSSCCFHRNKVMARKVAQKLLESKPSESGAYMLLSSFYGLEGNMEGFAKMRKMMIKRGIKKEKACTWIEIDGMVHGFESGDRSHLLSETIYCFLDNLLHEMKQVGYVPITHKGARYSYSQQDIDEHVGFYDQRKEDCGQRF